MKDQLSSLPRYFGLLLYTIPSISAQTAAEEHKGQGSNVEYNQQSFSDQDFIFLQAFLITSTSEWAVGSIHFSEG